MSEYKRSKTQTFIFWGVSTATRLEHSSKKTTCNQQTNICKHTEISTKKFSTL